MIDDRRLIGIDLGIASDHTVRVLDGGGSEVCRRRARPTVESLTAVEAAALAGAAAGVRLEVVIEPTGPAWLCRLGSSSHNRSSAIAGCCSPAMRNC